MTYNDVGSSERIELSVATFDNWVSKLVNLYVVELGLEPGEQVAVDLPLSWQASVIITAAWSAGLVLSLATGSPPALRVVGPAATRGPGESITPEVGPAAQVLACSLRPLGGRLTSPLPKGWLDFAAAVPGQADVILTPITLSAADPAVRTATTTWSHGQFVERATQRADEIGLEAGGRLLTDLSTATETGLLTSLAAPLAMRSSVVLLANADDAAWSHVAEQERSTCICRSAG